MSDRFLNGKKLGLWRTVWLEFCSNAKIVKKPERKHRVKGYLNGFLGLLALNGGLMRSESLIMLKILAD